jgi:hypothetical protein
MVRSIVIAVPLDPLRIHPLLCAEGFPVSVLGIRRADREQRQHSLERRGSAGRAAGNGRAANQKLEPAVTGGATVLE